MEEQVQHMSHEFNNFVKLSQIYFVKVDFNIFKFLGGVLLFLFAFLMNQCLSSIIPELILLEQLSNKLSEDQRINVLAQLIENKPETSKCIIQYLNKKT